MKVYEAMAEAFVAEGVTDVFGMMGDANMHWMNALAERDTRLYEVRHEGCGLGMADGWSRATGRPGVVTTTSGPGVSQLATSMLAASRARSSVVAFCGETPLGDETAVQYLDQRRFAHAVESEFVRVSTPEQAHEAVQRAFFLARTERTPVVLSAPSDVQKADVDDDLTYVPSSDLMDSTPLTPAAARIEEAAQLIAASRRVVVIVGRGARFAGADKQVLRLQELVGGLLATTLQTKNWLRAGNDRYAGISGMYGTKIGQELLQTADCVIGVGAGLNHFTIEHGYLYPDARFVQIDSAPQVVMGSGARADCYVRGDARVTLDLLIDALERVDRAPSEFRDPLLAQQLADADREQSDYVDEPGLLDPREAIRALDAAIPADISVVLGSGHQTDFGTMLFTRPREIVSNYGMFGAIGQAPLLTMGWIVGRGGAPTAVVEGDASFVMHLAEFETACRYGWPILVVVMNDEGLGAEYHKAAAVGLRPELSTIPSRNLGKVAEALGGRGALARSVAELEAAVRQFVDDPAPTVIDARISRTVLSVPYRRLWYAEEV